MVYAIASIGILGFIVWSHFFIASHLCYNCADDFILLEQFAAPALLQMFSSGSSTTTHNGFNLELFYFAC